MGIEHGGSLELGFLAGTSKAKGSQECGAKFDAVIFADGTYEGNEAAVRSLKALRDGLIAGVSYWARELNGRQSEELNESNLLYKLESRLEEDIANQRRYDFLQPGADLVETPLYAYWEGRVAVDRGLKYKFSKISSDDSPSVTFQNFARFIAAWKMRIEAVVSVKKLNTTFPPISDPSEVSDGDSDQR
jgi:hypothetical protein